MFNYLSTLTSLIVISIFTGYGKNVAAYDSAEAMFKHGSDQHSGSLA